MIRLPRDKHGNCGWVVKARRAFICYDWHSPSRRVEIGEFYYRAVAWPGTDANGGTTPWVLKLCRDCLGDDMRQAFDRATHYESTERRVSHTITISAIPAEGEIDGVVAPR